MYINGLQEQTLNIDNTSLDHITSFSAATCHKNDFCQCVTLQKGDRDLFWGGRGRLGRQWGGVIPGEVPKLQLAQKLKLAIFF